MRRLWLLALFCTAACGGDFERMRDQPRYDRYEPRPSVTGSRGMAGPPEGTVAREPDEERPAMTMELLEVGRARFDVYCAACHGVLGDGNSPVADQMPLRRPPSLLEGEPAAYSADELYAVVANGYGLMPSYAEQLSWRERWAVAGYVRALQVSHGVPLDTLPAAVQANARRALAGGAP